MLVPREDMALALRLHRESFERHIAAAVRSGHIDRAEIRRVGSAVGRALEEGPLSSTDLRKTIGRSDAGELLRGALIDLALRGIVRRFPAGARIDSPKYMYEWLHPDDRPDLDAEGDMAAVALKVGKRFLQWHGPATLDELAGWAELTRKAARSALDALGADAVAIAGWADEAWLLPGDLRAWQAFDAAGDDGVVLLPYRDPFVSARRGPGVLSERPDAPVLDRGKKLSRLADADSLHHHVIVSGGEVVGVWEYDPGAEAVVTRVWDTDRRLRARLAEAADDTGRFIREQLGDAKLSAVDPPAARARRVAFCRAAGSGRP
jgi:hypothetical protein